MTLRKEIQDVVDKWSVASEDGVITPEEGHELAREVFDVVRVVLSADDTVEARNQLADEVESGLSVIVDARFANNPMLRRGAKFLLGQASDQIVDKIALYTGSAEDFWREHVNPRLDNWQESFRRLRAVVP